VARRGDTVWSLSPSGVPEYPFASLQQAWRLPSGNTVINNWFIESLNGRPEDRPGNLQAIEVTPAKQVVWVLRSWSEPANWGRRPQSSSWTHLRLPKIFISAPFTERVVWIASIP
jgi:hypothetical protein